MRTYRCLKMPYDKVQGWVGNTMSSEATCLDRHSIWSQDAQGGAK